MAVKIATPPSKVSIVDTNGYGEINAPLNFRRLLRRLSRRDTSELYLGSVTTFPTATI
jgi:hypothetical protein